MARPGVLFYIYPKALVGQNKLSFVQNKRRRDRSAKVMAMGFSEGQILFVDHHLSHAASAYFGCPWWRDEPVLVLTNDAGGDDLCAIVWTANEGYLRKIWGVPVSKPFGYIVNDNNSFRNGPWIARV